jgi:hypothetical protein
MTTKHFFLPDISAMILPSLEGVASRSCEPLARR